MALKLWRDERRELEWTVALTASVSNWEVQFDYGPDEWHPVDSYVGGVITVLCYGPDFLVSEGVPQDGLGLLVEQTCKPRFRVIDNPSVPIVQGGQIQLIPTLV